MKYLIANWKSHKNQNEAVEWLQVFRSKLTVNTLVLKKLSENQLTIIIAPPYPLIVSLHNQLDDTIPNFFLSSQDISSLPEGSYTGEVTGVSLKGLVNYSIIGHSERRKYLGETDDMIAKKVTIAKQSNILPIVCVRNEHDAIPNDAFMVAYEPVEAIGTGNNASIREVLDVKNKMSNMSNRIFLYGGSVDANNCSEYLTNEEIDGFLVGSASLDPQKFLEIAIKM